MRAIKNVLVRGVAKTSVAPSTQRRASSPACTTSPRSSNLRIAKKFSQLDKDRFLHEGFEYLAKYFENSLKELAARNPEIEQNFRRIDANRFSASAYRQGEKLCGCTVYLGGPTNGIGYSMDDNVRSNSFNEALNVETDDQSIYFRSFGMQITSGPRDKLSVEGTAEKFWEIFMRPIQ